MQRGPRKKGTIELSFSTTGRTQVALQLETWSRAPCPPLSDPLDASSDGRPAVGRVDQRTGSWPLAADIGFFTPLNSRRVSCHLGDTQNTGYQRRGLKETGKSIPTFLLSWM